MFRCALPSIGIDMLFMALSTFELSFWNLEEMTAVGYRVETVYGAQVNPVGGFGVPGPANDRSVAAKVRGRKREWLRLQKPQSASSSLRLILQKPQRELQNLRLFP